MISRERIEVLRKLHDIPGHREDCETLDLLTALDEREELLAEVRMMMSQLHIEDRINNECVAAKIREMLHGGRFGVK